MLWNEPVFTTLHDAQVGDADGKILDLDGKYETVAIQAKGLAGATSTLTFQVSINGVDWVNFPGMNAVDGTTSAVSITADAIMIFPVAGIMKMKAPISNFTGTDVAHAVTVKAVHVTGFSGICRNIV